MLDRAFGKLAVVGLGKLGLPLACVLADKGHQVVGYDVSAELIGRLHAGTYQGHEPRVGELLAKGRERLSFAGEINELRETTLAFVVVPTPSDSSGRFSLQYVLPAIRSLARVAAERHAPYTIVLVSTVMPGDCLGTVAPAIRDAARGKAEVKLVYAPEFIALGEVVSGMLRPDLVLIGSEDSSAGRQVEQLLRSVVENQPRFVQTSFASAEIAKLGLNSLLAFKVTAANLLSRLCEEVPGADIDAASAAIGADRRIGDRFLKGGLGFGGPCLPRDVRALSTICRELGIDANVPDAVTRFNERIPEHVADLVLRTPPSEGKVGVLGLAYRPGTAVAEASHGVAIAKRLQALGQSVAVFDPLLRCQGDAELSGLRECHDAARLVREVDKVAIATTDSSILPVRPSDWRGKTVIDCWRCLPHDLKKHVRHYVALGISPAGSPYDEAETENACTHDDGVIRVG